MTPELLSLRLSGHLDGLAWIVSSTPPERFARRPRQDKWSAREHPAHLACYRHRFLEQELVGLVQALSRSELDRVGVHPAFGALTIPQWIDFFLFHEGHHAYTMMTLAASKERGASIP